MSGEEPSTNPIFRFDTRRSVGAPTATVEMKEPTTGEGESAQVDRNAAPIASQSLGPQSTARFAFNIQQRLPVANDSAASAPPFAFKFAPRPVAGEPDLVPKESESTPQASEGCQNAVASDLSPAQSAFAFRSSSHVQSNLKARLASSIGGTNRGGATKPKTLTAQELQAIQLLPSITVRRVGTPPLHGEHRSLFGCVAALQHLCYTQHDCDGRVPPLWPQICHMSTDAVPPAGWLRKAAVRCPVLYDAVITDVRNDLALVVQRHAATLHTIKFTLSHPSLDLNRIREELAMCAQLTSVTLLGTVSPSCLTREGGSADADTVLVPRLKHLVLDEHTHGFGDPSARRAVKCILRSCAELESIEILRVRDTGVFPVPRGEPITHYNVVAVLPSTTSLQVLKMPNLCKRNFVREQATNWLEPIAHCRHLHTVDFSYANFSATAFTALAAQLAQLTGLRSLDFRRVIDSSTILDDTAAKALAAVLEANSGSLESLNLSGAVKLLLTPVVLTFRRLQSLRSITVDGALSTEGSPEAALHDRDFWGDITHCTSLQSLHASNNDLSGCGEAIAALLRRLPRLAVLSLSRCSLTDADMVHVCGALLSAPALDTVDLSYNDCRDGGMSALAAAVRGADPSRRSVRRVDLQHNDHIGSGGFRDVLAALSERTLIDVLRLPGCGVTRAQLPALQATLPNSVLMDDTLN